MFIVYKYTNNVNGKSYIGKTSLKREEKRKYEHIKLARNGSNFPFHCAIREFGIHNFRYEVLVYVGTDKTALLMEHTIIKQFNTIDSNIGYNKLGRDSRGYEEIEKFKKSMKGKFSGDKNPMCKPVEYYETFAIRKQQFNEICKNRGWDINDFTYIESGLKSGNNKKYFWFKN